MSFLAISAIVTVLVAAATVFAGLLAQALRNETLLLVSGALVLSTGAAIVTTSLAAIVRFL